MKERWKDIAGYEDSYEISDHGNVRSKTRKVRNYLRCGKESFRVCHGKERTKVKSKKGYYSVLLFKDNKVKGFLVSRLVATAFIKGYKEGLYVNHKDFNTTNNHYRNLEWVTPRENVEHTVRHKKHYHGEKTHWSTITTKEAKEIYNSQEKNSVIMKKYGVSRNVIYGIKKKLSWKHIH